MIAPNYGSSFALWREGAANSWQAYTCHEFVIGLGDGSLPRQAFIHYLIQDYVYLVHYSRAWALAVVKADTLDEMKVCAGTVNALVNEEMALHVGICAEEGISEAQLFEAVEENENIAYTRYVMDAGLSGDFLDLLAALAPCAFGYGEIGLRLAATSSKTTPYRQWIDEYSGDDYQSMCATLGTMIDAAVERRIGANPTTSPRWKKLQNHFTKASELEADFWSMGMRGKPKNK